MLIAKNIVWDTDGDSVELPTTALLPIGLEPDEAADWLSDRYDYCIFSLDLDDYGPTLAAYHYWRAKSHYGAERALAAARKDVATSQRRYTPESGLASYQNKENDSGGRWIERPDLAGLRFVGFSDKLAYRMDHTGWWLDPDGDGATCRGGVWQLPARNGRSVYVEGHVTLEGDREQSTGSDIACRMPVVIYLGELHYGERGGNDNGDCEQAARDAACGADRNAEIYAQRERDYQSAWQAGSGATEKVQRAKQQRDLARRAFRDLRRLDETGIADDLAESLRARIRTDLRGYLEEARELYRQAAEAWDDLNHWSVEPFADGAGAASYWDSRK